MNNNDLVRDYPADIVGIDDIITDVGREGTHIKRGFISAREVAHFIADIQSLAELSICTSMKETTLKALPALITVLRVVNVEGIGYGGTNAIGRELVATWLEPWHIGNPTITNSTGDKDRGLYTSENGFVFAWDHSFIPNTRYKVFPSQVLDGMTAIVHLGVSDSVQIPKVIAMQHQIMGSLMPVKVIDLYSSCIQNNRDTLEKILPFANEKNADLFKYVAWPSFVAFDKPIVIFPRRQSEVTFYANLAGNSSPRLVSVLITAAQNLDDVIKESTGRLV